MEVEAEKQHLEIEGDTCMAAAYRERLAAQHSIEAGQRAATTEELNRTTCVTQLIFLGIDAIPSAIDRIEGASRLEAMASLMDEYGDAISKQETVEDEQSTREFRVYYNKIRADPIHNFTLPTSGMSAADKATLQDFFDAVSSCAQDKTLEERITHIQQKLASLKGIIPIISSVSERNPEIKSNPHFSALETMISSIFDIVAVSSFIPSTSSDSSTHIHSTAGDWARYMMQADNLGVDTLIGLARGFTRPVDARDPSDWMSLFWEVAVSAPSSSLIRHDVNCSNQTLFSELDRASEILALSYRHRVHGDQSHGLRYRLPECCWCELRLVVEAVLAGRPHGRVVLWWDQVLGATTKLDGDGIAWATVGLFPFVMFRVVYNTPGRCTSHNPVYKGRSDFEEVSDDRDIRRLWINLEHRLALRGCGLLMSRRAGAKDCQLWSAGSIGPKWEGFEHREIVGEQNMPMLGMRKIVAHLLRDEVGKREVTFAKDVVELQRWAAKLAVLPRREWAAFLAGKRDVKTKGLSVKEVVRVVLRAGAPTTLDGGGPLLASAPTVPAARISRGWSGVAEWAPLLREEALSGWMSPSVEQEVRQELGKFTVWICFPLETQGSSGDVMAIGKLWTPVQAVSSYMIVWLSVEKRFEEYQEQGPCTVEASSLYANGRVLKSQLVWPRKVEEFHNTFAGVHWSLSCMQSTSSEGASSPAQQEPHANSSLRCKRLPAVALFGRMVEEWGSHIGQHFRRDTNSGDVDVEEVTSFITSSTMV
ncbi:hypothetical protein FGB62_31g09 [Gracilaria domingensis]|nr:hypothetical protein FGB62_31g09 [Gracilaria domingensis]